MAKRLFDLIASLMGLLVSMPLLAIVAVFIKLDSRGPVFYKGIRSGQFGKPFKIFKFRTMIPDAGKVGGPSTALNDPRLTRIGRFLRKYKIDELPQLINVLCGEMSFVGPRPQVEEYTKRYSDEEELILSVRPGLTDYASLRFINLDEFLGDDDVDEKYLREVEPEKNRLRLEYVRNQSFWTDVKILIRTVVALLGMGSKWNT